MGIAMRQKASISVSRKFRRDVLEAVRSHLPDVLLLSAELLQEELNTLQQLVAELHDTRVILLTGRKDSFWKKLCVAAPGEFFNVKSLLTIFLLRFAR
jgi:hypothetical protein